MTPAAPSSIEASAWTSVLLILGVATVLGVTAVLLHATSRKANGRLVRPLLRIATGKPRARSFCSMTEVLPQQQQQSSAKIISRATTNSGEVWEAAARWVRWDPNSSTRAAVQGWIDSGDQDSATRWGG